MISVVCWGSMVQGHLLIFYVCFAQPDSCSSRLLQGHENQRSNHFCLFYFMESGLGKLSGEWVGSSVCYIPRKFNRVAQVVAGLALKDRLPPDCVSIPPPEILAVLASSFRPP